MSRLSSFGIFSIVIGIFIVRLPSFYIVPFHHILFTSHFIARVFFTFALVMGLYPIYNKQKKLVINNTLLLLLIFWFFSQSLSVLAVTNFQSFLAQYEDLLLGCVVFWSTYLSFQIKYFRFIVNSLIMSTIFGVMFEITTYIKPTLLFYGFKELIYENYWKYLEYQYNRGRFFGDSFQETIIPFIFYSLSFPKIRWKYLGLLLLFGGIAFTVFVSNWRTKMIIFLFMLASSIVFFRKMIRFKLPYFVIICGIIFITANTISLEYVGNNIIDRMLFEENIQTSGTKSRFIYWGEAVEIGNSSPLIGVGLGNYYENLSAQSQKSTQSSTSYNSKPFIARDDPHNILFSTYATTGIFGLGALILLVGYFFYSDMRTIIKAPIELQTTMLSFWGLFIFSTLNPSHNFGYQAYYWLLRGVIEKFKFEKDKPL